MNFIKSLINKKYVNWLIQTKLGLMICGIFCLYLASLFDKDSGLRVPFVVVCGWFIVVQLNYVQNIQQKRNELLANLLSNFNQCYKLYHATIGRGFSNNKLKDLSNLSTNDYQHLMNNNEYKKYISDFSQNLELLDQDVEKEKLKSIRQLTHELSNDCKNSPKKDNQLQDFVSEFKKNRQELHDLWLELKENIENNFKNTINLK